ncbi:MAG: hypothetical protein EOM85_04105 [Candidatus Moranbacteria bacterium]|nr:hypothetical protein [Candidatus Moranbacteria bacterium]
MELYSWAEVVDEFNHLYYEAKKNGFEPSDGSNLFDFITLDMMLRGAGGHIGYKFPEDLKAFRSVLSKLKHEKTLLGKKKKKINKELKFYPRIQKRKRIRKSSDELMMEYSSPTETLEEQVRRLGLNPDTYF